MLRKEVSHLLSYLSILKLKLESMFHLYQVDNSVYTIHGFQEVNMRLDWPDQSKMFTQKFAMINFQTQETIFVLKLVEMLLLQMERMSLTSKFQQSDTNLDEAKLYYKFKLKINVFKYNILILYTSIQI